MFADSVLMIAAIVIIVLIAGVTYGVVAGKKGEQIDKTEITK